MGAGLAGLACAHELRRYGIEPTIFEIRHRIGERFPNVETLAGMIQRPHNDAFRYFEQLGLPLRPTAPLNRLIVHGPGTRVSFAGNLGHITFRGHWPCSWERQIASQIKADVLFNRDESWQNLAADFDYVTVATGDGIIPESLGLWRRTVDLHIKGAVLRGRFDPNQVEMWFNTRYAKTGYAYLGPFDHRHASVAVSLPDATPEELDRYFERFCGEAEIGGDVITEFKTEGFPVGTCTRRRHGNVLFAGNAAGFVDPAFFFGQFESLNSGIMAGRAIGRRLDYDMLIAPNTARMARFLKLRSWLATMEDDDFDRAIWLSGLPGIRNLLFGTNIDCFGWLSRILTLANPARTNRA